MGRAALRISENCRGLRQLRGLRGLRLGLMQLSACATLGRVLADVSSGDFSLWSSGRNTGRTPIWELGWLDHCLFVLFIVVCYCAVITQIYVPKYIYPVWSGYDWRGSWIPPQWPSVFKGGLSPEHFGPFELNPGTFMSGSFWVVWMLIGNQVNSLSVHLWTWSIGSQQKSCIVGN